MPLKTQKLYVVNIHHYSFRPEEPALIIGYKMCTPDDGCDTRHAFEVQYEDGFIDYVAVDDRLNYLILTMEGIIQRAQRPKNSKS